VTADQLDSLVGLTASMSVDLRAACWVQLTVALWVVPVNDLTDESSAVL
jgi:hypothetical protein